MPNLFPSGTTAHMRDLSTGIRMRTYERGAGDVAIFLHGFPELAVSWRNQLESLSPHAHCVAPDLRGYGETDSPPDVASYKMDKLRADVIALVDALGAKKVHLVGHDWGGAVAWDVARYHPERFHTLTVLNCPPPDVMLRQMLSRPRQLMKSWYMFYFQLPGMAELMFRRNPAKLMKQAFYGIAKNRAVFTEEVLAPYIAQAAATGMHGGINYYRAAIRYASSQRPPKTDVPTRLVWGVHDQALGPWFMNPALYADVASRFDLVKIEDSGHWVQQEQPAKVNEAILAHWRQE